MLFLLESIALDDIERKTLRPAIDDLQEALAKQLGTAVMKPSAG